MSRSATRRRIALRVARVESSAPGIPTWLYRSIRSWLPSVSMFGVIPSLWSHEPNDARTGSTFRAEASDVVVESATFRIGSRMTAHVTRRTCVGSYEAIVAVSSLVVRLVVIGCTVYGETDDTKSESVSSRAFASVRPVSVTLGQRLRELRTARGLTLAATAPAAGISVSFLNDLEHDRHLPSLGTLVRVSEALGTSLIEILRGVPPYDAPS